MRRREFLGVLGGTAVLGPLAARAQQSDKVRRIGALMGIANDTLGKTYADAFQQGLRELGWTAGRNIRIDYAWASGAADMRQYARELMRSEPDALLAHGTPATIALRQQTGKIPIVFVTVSDPLGNGLVSSLARPSENVTGFTNFEFSMAGKWIELLKEIDSRLMRVVVIFNPQTAPYGPHYVQSIEAAARSYGTEVVAAPVQDAGKLGSAITAFASKPNGALIVLPDIFNSANREMIISLAAEHRLLGIYGFSYYIRAGGLISYGADQTDLFRRSASYIDRLLKGANVGDLPIQQPTKFEMVINVKTAKTLGLEIPPTVLARADELIE